MHSPSPTLGFIDPMLTSSAYHVHQAENALSTLKHIVSEDGWKKALKHKSGVVVHMKSGIFKGQAVIHGFSPQSIFYVIGVRKLWDENYEDGNLVENLNETTSLTYEVSKATATSKPRDYALVEKIECTQDGSIVFACTSVETPRIPKVPGRVRAHVKLQGWILEPVRGPTVATHVTYVIQETMKGWMPALAKKSLARRPLVIAAVNDYLQRKADRMRAQKKNSQQSLVHANTRHQPERLSELNVNGLHPSSAGSVRSNGSNSTSRHHQSGSLRSFASSGYSISPISSQLSTPVASPAASLNRPNNAVSARKRITFADHDTAYSAESFAEDNEQNSEDSSQRKQTRTTTPLLKPTPAVTKHLYPPHRHPAKRTDSMKALKQLSSSLDGWTSKGEKANVKMYIRMQSSGQQPLLRGDGIIEGGWTAEQLCSVVHCFGARKIWDERFEDGSVIERFSQKEYLVRWLLRSMFPVKSSDICAITSIDSDSSTGTVYTASTSVIDPSVPADGNDVRIRGHTDLYGWIFTPNVDHNGRTLSVNVTMICNMDYKCHVPANAAKVLGDEMLACVANLRSFMQQYGCPPYIRRVAGKVLEEDFEAKTGTYQIKYIAKHEPSQSYKARKGASGKLNWCTDIRIHKSIYPKGLDVKVSPSIGTRLEMVSDHRSIRIYTTQADMEGKHITVLLTKTAEKDRTVAAAIHAEQPNSSLPNARNTKDAETNANLAGDAGAETSNNLRKPSINDGDSLHPLSSSTTSVSPDSQCQDSAALASPSLQVPKGYKLVPQNQQNNNVLIISDELTFNGQQLAVVFIAMVICYYMGKFACSC